MSVTYRLLRSDEEGRAVAFWMRVLEMSDAEARQTFRDFTDDPQHFAQTQVAVAADGQLLATVCTWRREVRDRSGAAIPIGQLFHVATEPTAQRQGHATRLLDSTVQALRADGCAWAILSAREPAVGLYQRAGWQPTPRLYWRGTLTASASADPQRFDVASYDPRRSRAGWRPIADAYAHANAQHAGSLIRTSAYWTGYGPWMFGLYLDDYGAALVTVQDRKARQAIRGYALVTFSKVGFEVSELVADPAEPALLSSLLQGIAAEAQHRSVPLSGQVMVASDEATHTVLAQTFGATLHRVDDTALYGYAPFMVRPLADGVESPFQAPTGLFWPLDAY